VLLVLEAGHVGSHEVVDWQSERNQTK
jgi:hypothetical protein